MARRSSVPRLPVVPLSSQVSAAKYCHLETHLDHAPGLRVAVAGWEQCDAHYLVARDRFPCYALEFVASGKGELVLDGKTSPLHTGVLFVYGPSNTHRISNRSRHPLTKYFVDFCGGDVEATLRKAGLAPGGVAQTLEVETVRSLFEQMIVEGSKHTAQAKGLCAAYLQVILLKTAQASHTVWSADTSLASRFQRWQRFLETHCCRLHGLDDVAAELGVRPAYLCRVFKQFLGTSPFRFLTQHKMQRAANLLAGAGLPIKTVALEVGYADAGHFSRLFKSHFGCSPTDFSRQQWRTPTSPAPR